MNQLINPQFKKSSNGGTAMHRVANFRLMHHNIFSNTLFSVTASTNLVENYIT